MPRTEAEEWDQGDEGIAPWDGRRVPMTLLGGYLGSGKTTVLNELLRRTERPIAVLVNDVGTVNIDARLLRHRSTDTIELTDGCVCCSLSEGLGAALAELRRRPFPPDHVVIELSGVADPTQVLPWTDSDGFRLDGTVVLADATAVTERLADARTSPLVERQVAAADLIVMSKADLVTAEARAAVRADLASLRADVPIIDDLDGTAAAHLLDLGTRRARDVTVAPPPSLFDPHRTERWSVPSCPSDEALLDFLATLPDDVVRAKGIVEIADGSRRLVQQVGRRRRVLPLPAAEDQPPTDLVVIRI